MREVGIWPFPGLVATDGIFPPMGVVSCRPKHHTRLSGSQVASLSAFGRAPKQYYAPTTSSSREGDMYVPDSCVKR